METVELELKKDISTDTYMENLLDCIDDEEVNDLAIDVSDAFEIHTREQADYLTKQYLVLKQEADEIEQTAKDAKEKYEQKVDAWRDREISSRTSSMEWISSRLRLYAEQQLAGSKRRSLNLINGSLKFKKKIDTCYDEEVLKNFLTMYAPEFMKEQPKKIDKAGLKRACEVHGGQFYYNGRMVEGVNQVEMPDSFSIS